MSAPTTSAMVGRCPLCKSEGVDNGWFMSCSNGACILHEVHQNDTNRHVRREQWPQPCIFEARGVAPDGITPMPISVPTAAVRAWCQVHGFDCPSMPKTRSTS